MRISHGQPRRAQAQAQASRRRLGRFGGGLERGPGGGHDTTGIFPAPASWASARLLQVFAWTLGLVAGVFCVSQGWRCVLGRSGGAAGACLGARGHERQRAVPALLEVRAARAGASGRWRAVLDAVSLRECVECVVVRGVRGRWCGQAGCAGLGGRRGLGCSRSKIPASLSDPSRV